jgi:hypothetical protein
MKKKVFGFVLGATFMLTLVTGLFSSFNAQAEPDEWYATVTTIVWINGQAYIRSDCSTIPGSECNMPGSIHLIQLPRLWF